MNEAELAQSNQEQAVAAWLTYLNQLRLDNLLVALDQQNVNLQDALISIDEAISTIDLKVVTRNLGGTKGMHGFIAEVAEVGIGNARKQILGEHASYRWLNDNGPADLLRDGMEIQQKFYANRFSLDAIRAHLTLYPDFVENGGSYQIPVEQYEAVRELSTMSFKEAGKFLTRSGDGPSLKDWELVQVFLAETEVGIQSLEPSALTHHEVQRGTYRATLEAEKDSLRSTDQMLRADAYRQSTPTAKEGVKVTVTAAAVEGGTAFLMTVLEKRRTGKRLEKFTSDDWVDIARDTGSGVVKGGVRGVSIYSLTNFTATSAAAASSTVTAAFGVAEQANRLRRGEINELEFIENAEVIALEAAVSALSSFVGQVLIPIPILGAVIGNTVGSVMYHAASSSLAVREKALIERYMAEQRALDEELKTEYQQLIEKLAASMSAYLKVLNVAFSPDVEAALLGSVELALELGVASENVLDSTEKVRAYFLD